MHSFTYFLVLFVVAATTALRFSKFESLKSFKSGNALKVISGLSNNNVNHVKDIVRAAYLGGASHVDIACNPELVKAAIKVTNGKIPIMVSSVVPTDFVAAVNAGADMVEIGNYDSFYGQGVSFSAEDIIRMATETRKLLPATPLSVTIPHNIPLNEQIILAKKLESIGADVLQTEGKMSVHSTNLGVQELLEIATPTIASSYALSRAVTIPIICSSGLTDVTAPLALAAGAKGVGIGSMVNKLTNSHQMLMAVTAVAEAMGRATNNDDTSTLDIAHTESSVTTQSLPIESQQ